MIPSAITSLVFASVRHGYFEAIGLPVDEQTRSIGELNPDFLSSMSPDSLNCFTLEHIRSETRFGLQAHVFSRKLNRIHVVADSTSKMFWEPAGGWISRLFQQSLESMS